MEKDHFDLVVVVGRSVRDWRSYFSNWGGYKWSSYFSDWNGGFDSYSKRFPVDNSVEAILGISSVLNGSLGTIGVNEGVATMDYVPCKNDKRYPISKIRKYVQLVNIGRYPISESLKDIQLAKHWRISN